MTLSRATQILDAHADGTLGAFNDVTFATVIHAYYVAHAAANKGTHA